MSAWTWRCPCGVERYGNTVEAVEIQAAKHRSAHAQEIARLVSGAPPEGWHVGYNYWTEDLGTR